MRTRSANQHQFQYALRVLAHTNSARNQLLEAAKLMDAQLNLDEPTEWTRARQLLKEAIHFAQREAE